LTSAFEEVRVPRLVFAGTGSTTGKTVVTAGIMSALRRRGLRVKPFKVGPDFTDAAYLAKVAASPCRHLDPWLLGAEAILQSLHRGCVEGDVAIVEGMLGLYDSWGAGTEGSTAELAKLIGSPVILVLDVSGMVQNAAAIALGLKSVDSKVRINGVILNRVENDQHRRWVEEAVWRISKIPVLGAIPMLPELFIPEEDGGLTPPSEVPGFGDRMQALAVATERYVDVDLLLRIAESATPLTMIPRVPMISFDVAGEPVRLGVAYDDAFNLYFPENLELLADAGAEIVPFSPLLDHNLPRVDGVYLAGAASDRFASRLSENTGMLESMREANLDGVPIYAECGGVGYLADVLVGPDGADFPMVGLLPLRVEVQAGPRQMGYRQVSIVVDCLLGPAGQAMRGHEYHWSRILGGSELHPAYELRDPSGELACTGGYARPGLVASNIHLHFGQNPELALNLLRACRHGSLAESAFA
jgi:cobyrinic acid a,c-diamide synthase